MKVAARRALLTLFALAPLVASAKELAGHFGFGVANLGIGGGIPPSLSVDWHITPASAFEFDLGIDTDSASNLLLLGARYFRHVYIEENALFSAVAGGGLLSQQISGSSKSGYYLELGAGAKYFLPGTSNLGLGFVGSLGIRSAGTVRFMTQALFSVHYYF